MSPIPQIDRSQLEEIARRALAENLGDAGDITSNGIVRIDQPARARIFAKSSGVLAGLPTTEEDRIAGWSYIHPSLAQSLHQQSDVNR